MWIFECMTWCKYDHNCANNNYWSTDRNNSISGCFVDCTKDWLFYNLLVVAISQNKLVVKWFNCEPSDETSFVMSRHIKNPIYNLQLSLIYPIYDIFAGRNDTTIVGSSCRTPTLCTGVTKSGGWSKHPSYGQYHYSLNSKTLKPMR